MSNKEHWTNGEINNISQSENMTKLNVAFNEDVNLCQILMIHITNKQKTRT